MHEADNNSAAPGCLGNSKVTSHVSYGNCQLHARAELHQANNTDDSLATKVTPMLLSGSCQLHRDNYNSFGFLELSPFFSLGKSDF
jgi:hypothetical protein